MSTSNHLTKFPKIKKLLDYNNNKNNNNSNKKEFVNTFQVFRTCKLISIEMRGGYYGVVGKYGIPRFQL